MKWNSRKLISAAIAETLWTVLLVAGHIQPEHYVTLSLFTVGGYFAGNVGEHLARR